MGVSAANFAWIADLMRRETSMVYDEGKEYLVEARLLPLARAAGCADTDSYVARVRLDAGERRKARDALTINETSWFRDNEPYRVFAEEILPRLLAARAHVRHLRIWSGACSSGQEAYSIAMLLREHLPAGWTAEILATDVSRAMLDRVRAGRYSQVEMNRGMPAMMLVKNFTRAGLEWEVAPELRAMVRTQHLNLAAPFPALPTFDLVLMRNVLIYFEVEVKRDILRRVRPCVAPDGYLMLGSTETALDLDGTTWQRGVFGRVTVHTPSPPVGAGVLPSQPFATASSLTGAS